MEHMDHNKHVDAAMVIANYVYNNWNRPEKKIDGSSVTLVDNMCSSGYQACTIILESLGLLEPMDSLSRRNKFIVNPDDFEKTIKVNIAHGPSYEALIFGVITMIEIGEKYNKREALEFLTKIGICDPETADSRDKIIWTEKVEYYNGLFKNLSDLESEVAKPS